MIVEADGGGTGGLHIARKVFPHLSCLTSRSAASIYSCKAERHRDTIADQHRGLDSGVVLQVMKKQQTVQTVSSVIIIAAAKLVPLVVLLSSFPALVAQPVQTLVKDLPFTILSSLSPLLYSQSVYQILHTLLLCGLVFVPGTYALVVLMGAPFTTHIPETMLLSLHLTFLAFIEAIARFGLSSQRWRPLLPPPEDDEDAEDVKQNAGITTAPEWTGLEGTVWGTIAGAYLGAVPIPLDWDRDWQRWPVTIYVGAVLGLALGSTIQTVYHLITRPKVQEGRGSKYKAS